MADEEDVYVTPPLDSAAPTANRGMTANPKPAAADDVYYTPPQAPEESRSYVGDAARGFASSAVNTVGTAAGFLEYVFGSGGALTSAREGLNATGESLAAGMSTQMKTALDREFTTLPKWLGGESDKSAWEGFGSLLGSISAQAVSTSGSLVSAIPAIIAGAMGGTYAVPAAVIVGAATGAGLGAGSVWNDVATEFQKMPENARMQNPAYAEARKTMDIPSAIDMVVRDTASQYVNAAAATSAVANAAAGPFLGKLGAGKLGGIRRGAAHGVVAEGGEELLDEGGTAHFTALANEKLTGKPYDFKDVAESAVRGMVGGGALGGVMGGLGGIRGREPPAANPGALPPEIQAATIPPAGPAPVAPGPATPAPAAPAASTVDPAIQAAVIPATPAAPAGPLPGSPGTAGDRANEPVPTIPSAPTAPAAPPASPPADATLRWGDKVWNPTSGQWEGPAAAPTEPNAPPAPAAPPPAPVAPVAPVEAPAAPKPKRVAKPKTPKVAKASEAPKSALVVAPTNQPIEPAGTPANEPTVLPPQVQKRQAGARQLASDELRARAKIAAERVFGPDTESASDASVADLVNTILEDAMREIGDTKTKSVNEIAKLILGTAGPRLAESLKLTKEAQDTAEAEAAKKAPKARADAAETIRISEKDIMSSTTGDVDATRRIRAQLGRVEPRKLAETYARIAKQLANTDTSKLAWFNELKAIATTATRGGSVQKRAERAAFVKATLTKIAEQGAQEDASFESAREGLPDALASTQPTWEKNKSKAVILSRFRDAQRALAEALGVKVGPAAKTDDAARRDADKLRAEMRKKIGAGDASDTEAAALVDLFSMAARLDANTPMEMLQTYQAAEAMARNKDALAGLATLKETADIEASSMGTQAAPGEEGVSEERDPEALNQTLLDDMNLSGEGLSSARGTAQDRAAIADRRQGASNALRLEDRGQTREVEDVTEATDEDIAAFRAARAQRDAGRTLIRRMDDPGPQITRRGLLRGVGAGVLSWAMGKRAFATTVPAAERARAGDFKGALEAIAKHSPDAAHRALASRLAKLVDGIQLRIIVDGKDYAKDPFPSSLRSALGVTQLMKDGRVRVFLRDSTDPKYAIGINDETILHEAIHAALMARFGTVDGRINLVQGRLTGKPQPGDEHLQTLLDLYSAYVRFVNGNPTLAAEVKGSVNLRAPHRDFDEFIAYATTSPEFQAWMKRQTLNKQGVWQRFVTAIAGWFGMNRDERTFLEVALDATNSLLDAAATAPSASRVPAGPVDPAPGRFDRKQESGEDTQDDEESITKLMAMPDAIQNLMDRVPQHANESFLANVGDGLKRAMLGFSTSRQIEFYAEKYFPRTEHMDWVAPNTKGSLLQTAVVANNQRRQIAEDRMQKFLPAIRKMVSLKKTEEQEVSGLLIDASMAQVHPDLPMDNTGKNKHAMGAGLKRAQMRERHGALAARYRKLNPAQRDAYHAMLAAAEAGHKDAVASIISNVVDRWWLEQANNFTRDPDKNPLPDGVTTPAQAQKLVKDMRAAALADKMTDAQKEMMGDDWFGQIVKAHHRAKLDGPYVPFQRQGDFVVAWKEPEEEFRAFATEAEAETFAKNTPYDVRGTEQKFYHKDGTEIIEPDLGILLDLTGAAKDAIGDRGTQKEIDRAVRRATREALKKTQERDAAKTEWVVQQQVNGAAMFESLAEANQAARELREAGRKVDDVDLRKNAAQRRSDLQDADFNKIIDSIKNDKNLSDEQKNTAIDSLQEAMLMTLPNRALNSTLIRRRNVLGPSRDITRVMSNYGLAVSNFTAGIDTGLTITSALAEMNRVTDEGRRSGDADNGTTVARRRTLREMEMRLLEQPLSNPGTMARWVRRIQSMSFIHFLASPSYTAIQMTQPWLLTMPILAARYGAMSGPAALSRAMGDIGFGAIMKGGLKDAANATKTFITGKADENQPILSQVRSRLAKLSDGAGLTKMLDSLAAEGLVDGDAGLELIRAEVTADAFAWRKLGQLESMTRAIPAAVEVINRTSSAVAAYRLEMKRSGDHDKAVLAAREVVDQSQADYSTSNAARYMDSRRYPWIAPMMTFRKYAQAVYALLGRQVYLAFKGTDKAERRQAIRTLAYVLGAHAAVAGTLGLPTEAITIVLGVVAMALGQDEPWDWEKEVRQAMASVFGKEAGEVLARGLPRAVGIDLHARMGLNSLMFVNDLRDFEKRSTMEYIGGLLTGAPGSMLTSYMNAPMQAAKGDWGKAAEAALPKGIRDVIKSTRFADEGVTTKKGERIDQGREFSVGDAILQGLGFSPAWVSEVYERRQAVQGENRRFTAERTELIRNWRQAKPANRAEQWDRIMEWNREVPPELRKERITRSTLIAAEAESKRRAKASGGADYLPKGRESLRREGEFANVR